MKNVHEKGPIVAYCEICNRGFQNKTKAGDCRRKHLRKETHDFQVSVNNQKLKTK